MLLRYKHNLFPFRVMHVFWQLLGPNVLEGLPWWPPLIGQEGLLRLSQVSMSLAFKLEAPALNGTGTQHVTGTQWHLGLGGY